MASKTYGVRPQSEDRWMIAVSILANKLQVDRCERVLEGPRCAYSIKPMGIYKEADDEDEDEEEGRRMDIK